MTFAHPTLHIIDAATHRVISDEVFPDNRWYGGSEIIARHGVRYRIESQQIGAFHYYIWVSIYKE